MNSGIALEARIAVTDAIHAYYHFVDSGHASHAADLFQPDGKLIFGLGTPKPGILEGEAIAASMREREALISAFTRHATVNITLSRAADDAIAARHLLILFRSDDETRSTLPRFVADVEDVWVDRGSGWKLAERLIVPAFAAG